MDVIGAEDLGPVAAPIDKRGTVIEGPAQASDFAEGIGELLMARSADASDTPLVRNQVSALLRACEDGTLHMPTFSGDYVPVVASSTSVRAEDTAITPKPGPDMVRNDVLVADGDGKTVVARPVGIGVVIEGLGPRTSLADDGAAPLVAGSQARASDVVSLSAVTESFQQRSSIENLETHMWCEHGLKLRDLRPAELDTVLAQVHALSPTPSPPITTSLDNGRGVIRAPVTPRDVELPEDFVGLRKRLAATAGPPQASASTPGEDIVGRYRDEGAKAVRGASSRVAADTGVPVTHRGIRAIGQHVGLVEDKHYERLQRDAAGLVDDASIDAIVRRAAEDDTDTFATEAIARDGEDGSDVQAHADTDRVNSDHASELTPASKMAFEACRSVCRAAGFALDMQDVLRAGEASLLDAVGEERRFEGWVDTRSRELQGKGWSSVHSDIISRDAFTRKVVSESPEEFLAFCAYHLVAAMIKRTCDTGRLAIVKLNSGHKDTFGTRTPLSTDPPSVIAYTSRVLRDVREVGGVVVAWKRSVPATADRLAMLAKKRLKFATSLIPKFSRVRSMHVPDDLLPPPDSSKRSDRKDAIRFTPFDADPAFVPTHRPGPVHANALLNVPQFESKRVTRAPCPGPHSFDDGSGHLANDEKTPRRVREILRDPVRSEHILHIVAPVFGALAYADPLPPWTSPLLKADDSLLRAVGSLRKDTLPSDAIDSPSALSKHDFEKVRDALADFLHRIHAVSPASMDLIVMLEAHLRPLKRERERTRMVPTVRPSAERSDGDVDSGGGHEDQTELLWGDTSVEYEMVDLEIDN